MARPLRRVRIVDDSSLLDVLHDVHADRVPRLIERDGEPLAVVLDPSDYPARSTMPTSRRRKSQLLALAGAWRDLDAEQLIADLYRARDEAPLSPEVNLDPESTA